MNQPTNPVKFIFERQFQHLLLLACLVPGALYLAEPSLGDGSWLGVADSIWFYTGIAVVILHQVLVWFVFRFQLVYSLLTNLFGKHALTIWGFVFMPLLALRPLMTIAIGIADYNSITSYRSAQIVLGIILLVPAVYTLYSVIAHFGLPRALGADHFDEIYRHLPMVTQGAFRFSSNAMYSFAFLLLWSIALLTGSRAALAAALFQHAYIWVHMYCTEEPDMHMMYG